MPFKATCPHCDATMTIMSPLAQRTPMQTAPIATGAYKPSDTHDATNDVIRCDACTGHSVVVEVKGDIVRVKGLNFSVMADPKRGRA